MSDAAAKIVVTMDYGACNVIYIDRRATDDVCDTAENRYEQEHHSNQDEQAQAQEQEQAPKHKLRHLQQRQHNDRDDTPLSTAATTTTTTAMMTASATTSLPATATAGAVLDRDTSRRRPAYYQRQPSDVCRNLDAILGTFARGKDEIAQRATACETLSAHPAKPFFVLPTEQQSLLLRIAFNVCTETDANIIFPYRQLVYICASGQSCLDRIDELYQSPHLASTAASLSASSKKLPESSPSANGSKSHSTYTRSHRCHT